MAEQTEQAARTDVSPLQSWIIRHPIANCERQNEVGPGRMLPHKFRRAVLRSSHTSRLSSASPRGSAINPDELTGRDRRPVRQIADLRSLPAAIKYG
jgi:hypothetical protein